MITEKFQFVYTGLLTLTSVDVVEVVEQLHDLQLRVHFHLSNHLLADAVLSEELAW
jgi:hypothetical protein